MIIYNKITELVYDQFLIIFVLDIAILLLTFLLFKKKLSLKVAILSFIIAIVLSLISIMIVNGFYGGMAYHERFGWPFQFNMISRSIEDTLIPYTIHFDIWKFIANTIYWGIIPLLLLLEILSKKKSKGYQLFIIGCITLYTLLTIFFSYINTTRALELNIGEVQETTVSQEPPITDLAQRKKDTLEKEYTEFKDFEKHSSFSGVSVKISEDGTSHYFAYIVHGSGVPIALATCFKVDSMFKVYKVGEFPDYLDSYMGYMDIDPVTCKGIK